MQNKFIYIVALLFIFACKQQSVLEDFLEVTPSRLSMQDTASLDAGIFVSVFENNKKVEDKNVIVGTFLGNESRNFYGDSSAGKLDIIWKTKLGSGYTRVNSRDGLKKWSGAGWTGQPLVMKENDEVFLFQGCYDHTLKKINALSGQIIWSYEYDDILKGTGSICKINSTNDSSEYFVLQGSRLGNHNSLSSKRVFSYRSINTEDGTEYWRFNVKRGPSYSRDVDGSALILNDTAYLGMENGYFVVFDPIHTDSISDGKLNYLHPKVIEEHPLFDDNDNKTHFGNLVTESSPCKLKNRIYITSGSGHIYGYNLETDSIDWDLEIGSDIDGSPAVTSDSCLLVSIEKQYIKGNGGVMKINPDLPPRESVVWFQPSEDKNYADWKGGVIGSASTNAFYNENKEYPNLGCFIGIDGYMYVVEHDKFGDSLVLGPNLKITYKTPKLLHKIKVGSSISTPIIVDNRIVVAGYKGVRIFEFDDQLNIKELAFYKGTFETTPVAIDGKIYVASRNGYLYCFGDSSSVEEPNLLSSRSENIQEVKKNIVINRKEEDVKVAKNIAKEDLSIDKQKGSNNTNMTNADAKVNFTPKIEKLTEGTYYIVVGAFSVEKNAINENAKNLKLYGNTSGLLFRNSLFYIYSHKSKSKIDLINQLTIIKEECNCKAWILKN